jgi:hypothetical protein
MSSLAFPAHWGRRDGVRPHASHWHRKARFRETKPVAPKYRSARDWPESTDAVIFGPCDPHHWADWTDADRMAIPESHLAEGERS